jgi:hypothetical protein
MVSNHHSLYINRVKSLINKGNQVDIILKPEKLQEKKKIRKINIEELEV